MAFSRWATALAGWGLFVASSVPAQALAATQSVAYFTATHNSQTAYLIDWLPEHAAHVVNYDGAGDGVVAKSEIQRVISLTAPISFTFPAVDDCLLDILIRRDLSQVVVRDQPKHQSELVEIGTETNIGGCHDGLVTPFGSLTDAGTIFNSLDLVDRPPVDDLGPGSQIVGFSEDVHDPDLYGLSQDLVTLKVGEARFKTSGHVVPAVVDANQWLVFSFPDFKRAYTRLALDPKTGGETWLLAELAGGQPQRVEAVLVVKPLAGATFGGERQASRSWESGLFVGTRRPFFVDLYRGGTGERVQVDLDLGTEIRTPITWGFDGLDILQRRAFGDGWGDRTWRPIRNEGKHIRWVLESEMVTDADGQSSVLIKPRVNYYLDRGKAVPPLGAVADKVEPRLFGQSRVPYWRAEAPR
jgi:hypothetical protein